MKITHIQLKHFRCFEALSLSISSSLVLIQGANGSGKTSLLEALYYSGHLRSFKTPSPKELMQHMHESFFIKIAGELEDTTDQWHIQAGYSSEKRIVKINDTPAKTYHDLYTTYRVISIAEDDMALIQGAPEIRRLFLDDAISLASRDYRLLLKKYRKVLEQRNALLQGFTISEESYTLWTEQLVVLTEEIRKERNTFLMSLEEKVNTLLEQYCSFENPALALTYTIKRSSIDQDLKNNEFRAKKSLIGAHLDDFSVVFIGKNAKNFASRGQQKLLTILLKIAAGNLMEQSYILLLDDFMTDFDELRIQTLLRILTDTPVQLLCTIPTTTGPVHAAIQQYPHQIITLASPH